VLTDTELWVKHVIDIIRKTHDRYLKSLQTLHGARTIVGLSRPTFGNSIEEALIEKVSWEKFIDSLTKEELVLLEEILDGLGRVSRQELAVLRSIYDKLIVYTA